MAVVFQSTKSDGFSHIIAYYQAESKRDYIGSLKYSRPEPDAIFINELQVSLAYRGRGYGKLLLDELFTIAPAEEYRLIARECYENWGRLEAFYERSGFRAHAERETWSEGTLWREIDMARKLTPAPAQNDLKTV